MQGEFGGFGFRSSGCVSGLSVQGPVSFAKSLWGGSDGSDILVGLFSAVDLSFGADKGNWGFGLGRTNAWNCSSLRIVPV